MENGTRTDRVGRIEFAPDPEARYLAWRQVAALESIATFCQMIETGLALYFICYMTFLLVNLFRGKSE